MAGPLSSSRIPMKTKIARLLCLVWPPVSGCGAALRRRLPGPQNKQQYDAAIAPLPPHIRHRLTAWRGLLFTVELYAGNGMTLKTHPLKGWIE